METIKEMFYGKPIDPDNPPPERIYPGESLLLSLFVLSDQVVFMLIQTTRKCRMRFTHLC